MPSFSQSSGTLIRISRVCAALAVSFVLTVAGASAVAIDPNPPGLTVDYYFPPSPLVQAGTYRLVYEMRLTNYTPLIYKIEEIDAQAGAKTFTYSGSTLTSMMKVVGQPGFVGTSTIVETGATQMVFFTLAFDRAADVPPQVGHALHVVYTDGSRHVLQTPPLLVDPRPPVVVAPPLRGSNWIAFDATHNGAPLGDDDGPIDAAHRRTTLPIGGRPYLAQRYAIDWLKYKVINGLGETFSGPVEKNSSYFCYGDNIYSVAPGRIVDVYDGLPDNVPQKPPVVPINVVTAGGNHVVVDIGNGRFAFYAHMIAHSMPAGIKVGAYVTQGQILGHVGNSGSSTEPHLHFHVVDGPSFLGANGVPYEMTSFSAGASATYAIRKNGTSYFQNIGPLKPFHNDYPQAVAPVAF
jgi:hypothetical protein